MNTTNFRGPLGVYWKGRRQIKRLANEYVENMNKDHFREKLDAKGIDIHPAICFSRKIGVGTLEIAQQIGEKLGMQVVDREIIEEIAKTTQLSKNSVSKFDERYPGKIMEMMCRVLGDSVFDMNTYARHLFYVAFCIASMESTIFVGRGIHLILPRTRLVAVRCVRSKKSRVKNVAEKLHIEEQKSERILNHADKEQHEFFHKVHGLDTAHPLEFDMVLNLDCIDDLDVAAATITTLFVHKFPTR